MNRRRSGALRRPPQGSWTLAVVAGAAIFCAVANAATAEPSATRRSMGAIFESMRSLLFIAIDRDDWISEEKSAEIDRSLETLQQRSGDLRSHVDAGMVSFDFYSHQLTEGIDQMERYYRAGQRDLARIQLFHLVDTCVACHSRLPTLENSSLSERFAADARIRTLPIDERVRLEVATRRFEAALQSYEEMIRSPEFTPRDLDLLGILDDYITLCFQVRSNRERPRRSLEALLSREDVSESLRADVQHWLAALKKLPDLAQPARLEDARELTRRAQRDADARTERNALIDYLGASALLHRLVDDVEGRTAVERAEAYYLLAVVESAVGRAFWPAPEEAYLESAIRLAPKSETSLRAFELLQELVGLGYTGSGGTRIPPEVAARLEILRMLATPDVSPDRADGASRSGEG